MEGASLSYELLKPSIDLHEKTANMIPFFNRWLCLYITDTGSKIILN